jgi:hypothetical protein
MKLGIQVIFIVLLSCLPTVVARGQDCGAPQTIYGQVTFDSSPVPHAVVTLQAVDAPLVRTARVSSFGWYSFPESTPCLEYRLTVSHKRGDITFPQMTTYADGSGWPVRVDIVGVPVSR